MSLKNNKYKEMIRKYHQNILSQSERHQLELEALDDPFLSDALEGYEKDVDQVHLHEIESEIKHKLKGGGNSSFLLKFIRPSVVLIGICVLLNPWIYNNNPNEHQIEQPTPIANVQHTEPNGSKAVIETVIEDEQLDQASELPKKEWIESISVAGSDDENKLSEKPNASELYEFSPISKVAVDVPKKISDSSDIKKELKKKSHPEYYLFDLKVANYRNFRSGDMWLNDINNSVAAQYENGNNQQNSNHGNGYKSNEKQKISYDVYLEDCMRNYKNGKMKLALRGFNTILKNYPDDANALFYAGLSTYNLGLTEKATDLLEKSYNHPFGVFKEESEWLWSLALLKNGDKLRSLKIMKSIANSDHFYTDRAKSKLLEIEN